ncbi:MAG TPA: 3-methyl-2-oxobutanoate hydroxymethyltransferase [Pseudomonadales bacterium]|nr:3-methyl-2-oxobutanoate hydroxymethyltransferase [Pseudomonadales bacterium]
MSHVTLTTLNKLKQSGEKFAVLTAYDSTFSNVVSSAGVEVILIGDSLGMVLQGNDSTVPVTMEHMIYHTQCVKNGNQGALIMSDLPFMAHATENACLENSARLMQAGAHVVKIEGGDWLMPSVEKLAERGVPVCVHLGLTPQSVNLFGGYKVQGREQSAAQQMLADAKKAENSGAALLLLECVPAALAAEITRSVSIPVIGIGAGVDCDGQVLVLHDMLGITPGKKAKFVKNFLEGAGSVEQAIKNFVAEVKAKTYPAAEHTFQ